VTPVLVYALENVEVSMGILGTRWERSFEAHRIEVVREMGARVFAAD